MILSALSPISYLSKTGDTLNKSYYNHSVKYYIAGRMNELEHKYQHIIVSKMCRTEAKSKLHLQESIYMIKF